MSWQRFLICDICGEIIRIGMFDSEENYKMGPYQHAHNECYEKEYGFSNRRNENEQSTSTK